MELNDATLQLLTNIIIYVIAPICLAFATGIVELIKTVVVSNKIKSTLTDVDASIGTAYYTWSKKFQEIRATLSADGTFSKEDMQEALEGAADSALKTLTAGTIAFLTKNGVDITAYLVGKISARLEADDIWH